MILADTHTVLWFALEPDRVSSEAGRAFAEARIKGRGVAIAGITLWEIALLERKGRVELRTPLATFLRLAEEAYHVLPLNSEIAMRAIHFSSNYPKDPADRLIGATALVHGLPLVTMDRAIRASGEVPTIW